MYRLWIAIAFCGFSPRIFGGRISQTKNQDSFCFDLNGNFKLASAILQRVLWIFQGTWENYAEIAGITNRIRSKHSDSITNLSHTHTRILIWIYYKPEQKQKSTALLVSKLNDLFRAQFAHWSVVINLKTLTVFICQHIWNCIFRNHCSHSILFSFSLQVGDNVRNSFGGKYLAICTFEPQNSLPPGSLQMALSDHRNINHLNWLIY